MSGSRLKLAVRCATLAVVLVGAGALAPAVGEAQPRVLASASPAAQPAGADAANDAQNSAPAPSSQPTSQPNRASGANPFEMSLEELLNSRVISVSKKETSLADSPAAISVITADDISRLGITSLPEALRLVPGVEVARINSHSWAISTRGFNGQYSDKLLVLIDGRIVYEARFPGVYWDVQDLVLEDLDRIEVIRGPGATLWGANAVNGVINIITKRPADTQGVMVSASAGNDDRPTASLRYGGTIGSRVDYRVHGKLVNRDELVNPDGAPAWDAWQAQRGGVSAEWRATYHDTITLDSDVHHVDGNDVVGHVELTPPFQRLVRSGFRSHGGHVLGRWAHSLGDTSSLSLQGYYAGSSDGDADGSVDDHLADVEFQHRFVPSTRHDIVWGVGYRRRSGLFTGMARQVIWNDPSYLRTLRTAFVQDEMAIVPDRLHLTVGSKFEHNSATGFSMHPSARLLWTPHRSHAVWAAVSQAYRTPDLFESGGRFNLAASQLDPQGPVVETVLFGVPNLADERVRSYEAGYRVELSERLSLDVAGFCSDYSHLLDFMPGAPVAEADPVPHVEVPLWAANIGDGRSSGIEISAHWNPARIWRLSPSYSFLHIPFLDGSFEFASPTHRAGLVSYLTLPRRFGVNGAVSYVARLNTPGIPAYTRLDLGVTWQGIRDLEFGVWGQNLLDDRHAEFFSLQSPQPEEVTRSMVARVTWRPRLH